MQETMSSDSSEVIVPKTTQRRNFGMTSAKYKSSSDSKPCIRLLDWSQDAVQKLLSRNFEDERKVALLTDARTTRNLKKILKLFSKFQCVLIAGGSISDTEVRIIAKWLKRSHIEEFIFSYAKLPKSAFEKIFGAVVGNSSLKKFRFAGPFSPKVAIQLLSGCRVECVDLPHRLNKENSLAIVQACCMSNVKSLFLNGDLEYKGWLDMVQIRQKYKEKGLSFPRWTPVHHFGFSLEIRRQIRTVLLIAQINTKTGKPWHPTCYLHKLPSNILYLLIQQFAGEAYL